ncbi:MAG TPA: GMC oxidoreductase, partial [Longimicrobiales bacterium]|nr:GMC oxidoreductase [Longimicrobiales bacterium]
ETDGSGRVDRVVYLDPDGLEQAQRARAVVLCGNGAETPRLLLLSESSRFPDGLANSSGLVGRNLMFNGYSQVLGIFPEPLNEHKSVVATRIVMDFYDSDPARGFYGGGGIDARSSGSPLLWTVFDHPRPGGPTRGAELKRQLAQYPYAMSAAGHSTSLPVESNTVTLDPELQDAWGRPAIRVTYTDHPDDLACASFLQDRSVEMLEAAGATEVWRYPVGLSTSTAHLLGTCRMGDDARTSVVDRHHRAHDVPNLFICDGSSLVTGGRGQPTMTIQALAFRAADHITAMAQAAEI